MLAALRNQFGGHAVKAAPRARRAGTSRCERQGTGTGRRPARGGPLAGAQVAGGTVAATTEPENPLIAGLERLPVAPTTLVIFGATGDLARRKLLPALYNLAHDGALPGRFHLVGVARREKQHEDYRAECEQAIRQFSRRTPDEDVLKRLLEHVRYVPGTFDDEKVYARLEKRSTSFERARRGSRSAGRSTCRRRRRSSR